MIPAADPLVRRQLYGLVIALAAGLMGARILAVERICEPAQFRPDPGRSAAAALTPLASTGPVDAALLLAADQHAWAGARREDRRGVWPARRPEPVPTLGVNDRSRWLTVRALVDQGTYAIGRRETNTETGRSEDSGPVTEDGWYTMDKILVPGPEPGTGTFYSSKPPFLSTLVAGEYGLLKSTLGWSILHDRWRVVPAILLTVNWLPFVVYLVLLARIVERFGATDWGRLYVLAAAGFGTFMTSFSACLNNHTVAACCCLYALSAALRIWHDGDRGIEYFVAAGLFAGLTACTELPALCFACFLGLTLTWASPSQTLRGYLPSLAIPVAVFLLTNQLAIGRLMPAYSEVGGPWYQYPGSYWERLPGDPDRRGIDWASERETRAVYAFHLLVGHHGFFSLSPIFLLTAAAAIGSVLEVWRGRRPQGAPGLPIVMMLTWAVSMVVVAFYVGVVSVRNYGGVTHGPRWLLWLTPLWLVSMLPAADRLAATRVGRALGYVLLGVSMVSVNYPPWTPWHHPWLYDLLESAGWIRY